MASGGTMSRDHLTDGSRRSQRSMASPRGARSLVHSTQAGKSSRARALVFAPPRQLAVSSGCDGNDPQGTAGAADDFQWCGDDNGASWRKLIKVGQTG
jgi:hypothetical protein